MCWGWLELNSEEHWPSGSRIGDPYSTDVLWNGGWLNVEEMAWLSFLWRSGIIDLAWQVENVWVLKDESRTTLIFVFSFPVVQ